MRFVVLSRDGNLNKYLDRFTIYTSDIGTVIDVILDGLNSQKCNVAITVRGDKPVYATFNAICSVLRNISCEYGHDQIVIKINSVENLRDNLSKILHGFDRLDELKEYGIEVNAEMVVNMCGKEMRFEVRP